MSILGLDIGTTNCKGAVYSMEGEKLASASREYSILHKREGWAELDSTSVMESVFEIVRELSRESKNRGDTVQSICVSALGEAITPVSKDRRILGNAILHFDQRGKTEIAHFLEKISPEEIYSINANIPSSSLSLAKILWWKKHDPELFRNTDKFLLFGELFFYLAGCNAVTSFSQAGRTLLFDIQNERWSDRILNLAGLEPERFARPVPSGTIAGEISEETASSLDLDSGVLCIVGAHDQCSNALGVGICAPGKAVDGIGTVECMTPVYDKIPSLPQMLSAGLNVEHHAVPGQYVSFIYNQAGILIKWYRDTFAQGEKACQNGSIYEFLEKEIPPDPTRLLVLPHFEATGSPGFIENSSGVILGLRTSTTRGEIFKAIMECETFYFLECIETLNELGIDTSRFVASGGGAKSSVWLQIKADIMGVPFERSSEPEAGILGAVIIASKSLGIFPSYEAACRHFIKPGTCFDPDLKKHEIYREKFGKYRQIYPRLQDILQCAA